MDKIVFVESTVPNIKQEPMDIKEEPIDIKPELINIKEEPSSSTNEFDKESIIIIKQELDSDNSSTDDENGPSSSSGLPNKKGSSRRKKVMRSQARELIALVYQHMKKEAVHGVENVTDARWRTSQATGVSEKTVTRILKEKKKADETGNPIRSPHRNKKPRKCLRRNIEERDKNAIKETINDYEIEFYKPPTLSKLKKLLEKRIGYQGCIETLRRVLVEIGYEFRATDSNGSRGKVLVQKE